MGGDVRVMQRRSVKDCIHSLHASLRVRAIGDRSNVTCSSRSHNIESNHIVSPRPQHSHQRLPEMSSAACNQDLHMDVTRSRLRTPLPLQRMVRYFGLKTHRTRTNVPSRSSPRAGTCSNSVSLNLVVVF